MEVRPLLVGEIPALAELYRDSVLRLGSLAYAPPQIAAWASYPDDAPKFTETLKQGISLVSVEGGELAAFGQLNPSDCVSLLYCGGRFARRGHATAIYRQLEAAARRQKIAVLRTTASRVSRPFFEKQGFSLVEVERNIFKGVEFERFKLEKPISGMD